MASYNESTTNTVTVTKTSDGSSIELAASQLKQMWTSGSGSAIIYNAMNEVKTAVVDEIPSAIQTMSQMMIPVTPSSDDPHYGYTNVYVNAADIKSIALNTATSGSYFFLESNNNPQKWSVTQTPSALKALIDAEAADPGDFVTLGTTQSISGEKTFNGDVVMDNLIQYVPQSITATGTVQGDSAQITQNRVLIIGGNVDTGVKLPAGATSASVNTASDIQIYNGTGTNKKVYPTTGQTIFQDGIAVNVPIDLGANQLVTLTYVTGGWIITDSDAYSRTLTVDGQAGSPGLGFRKEPSTGFYRSSAGVVLYYILGTEIFRFTSGGINMVANIIDGYARTTAAGTVQGDAAAITHDVTVVINVTGVTGVVLPTNDAGMRKEIFNSSTTNSLIIYPAVGYSFGTMAVNTPISLPPNTCVRLSAIENGGQIWVIDTMYQFNTGIAVSRNPYTEVSTVGANAITIPKGNTTFDITALGVSAMTIADPTTGTDDGLRLTFMSTSANAHTLSNAAGSGFNNGGAGSDVGTFGGAIGDNIVIEALKGKWYVVSKVNVTLA